MNGHRRLIGSFSHGSMANAVPQAIGVQASQPGRQVVTLSGDGGLAMMLGDLLTLQQLHLPVKVVVFNNGYAVLPLAGVYKRIWDYDARTLGQDLSAHLLYGATTSAAFAALTRSGT